MSSRPIPTHVLDAISRRPGRVQLRQTTHHEIDGWPRPLLDVSVGDGDDLRVRCLVDSGAMSTLLPSWVADLAGIDCADAPKALSVTGASTKARMVATLLTSGEHSLEAEVGFCFGGQMSSEPPRAF